MKKIIWALVILFGPLFLSGSIHAKSCDHLLTKEYFRLSAKLARAQSKGDPFTRTFLKKKVDSLRDTTDLMKELATGKEGRILYDILLGIDTKKITRKKARGIIFAVYNNNGFCFVPKRPLPGGEKISWVTFDDLNEGLESGYLERALDAWRKR